MSTADDSSCQTSGCSIKGRPYPGPGPGASPPFPSGPEWDSQASPRQDGPSTGVRPFSIQQWKETVLKQLNFYSIEEHFFFGMLILIFCVFGSNRNVDVRSEQDDRQSNTMIPHCWETQQLEGIQLHPLAMDFKTTLGGGPPSLMEDLKTWWRIYLNLVRWGSIPHPI